MRPLMTWPRFVASALAIVLGIAWCAPDLNEAYKKAALHFFGEFARFE